MIIVLSDTHDYFNLIRLLIEKYKKENIEAIIHCGDVVDFNIFMYLKKLTNNIYLVFGNNDRKTNIHILKHNGVLFSDAPFEFEIENYGNFVIMHEPYYIEDYRNRYKHDYILYGHLHEQKMEQYKNKIIMNPGAFGKFRNEKPQYALITKKDIILKGDINV